MKKIILTILFLFLLLNIVVAIPDHISIAGQLTGAGASSQTGTFNISVFVYDAPAAGVLVLREDHRNVYVYNSLFNLTINNTALDFGEGKNYYVAFNVNEGVIGKRTQILTQPYTFKANVSEKLINNANISVHQLNVSYGLNLSGNVKLDKNNTVDIGSENYILNQLWLYILNSRYIETYFLNSTLINTSNLEIKQGGNITLNGTSIGDLNQLNQTDHKPWLKANWTASFASVDANYVPDVNNTRNIGSEVLEIMKGIFYKVRVRYAEIWFINSTYINTSNLEVIKGGNLTINGSSFGDLSEINRSNWTSYDLGRLFLNRSADDYSIASSDINYPNIANASNLSLYTGVSLDCDSLAGFTPVECSSLEDGDSGMDYTNIAMTNQSEQFEENVNISAVLNVSDGTSAVDFWTNDAKISKYLSVAGIPSSLGFLNLGGLGTEPFRDDKIYVISGGLNYNGSNPFPRGMYINMYHNGTSGGSSTIYGISTTSQYAKFSPVSTNTFASYGIEGISGEAAAFSTGTKTSGAKWDYRGIVGTIQLRNVAHSDRHLLYGIYGSASPTVSSLTNKTYWAGYFDGDVQIPTNSKLYLSGASTYKGNAYLSSNNSDISAYTGDNGTFWVSNSISAKSYVTRTSVYNKSKGKALNYILDAGDLISLDGKINHSKFYGYKIYEMPDYSKPVIKTFNVTEFDVGLNQNVTREYEYPTYPYTRIEEAVSLTDNIAMLSQAVYELKQENILLKQELCKIKSDSEICK